MRRTRRTRRVRRGTAGGLAAVLATVLVLTGARPAVPAPASTPPARAAARVDTVTASPWPSELVAGEPLSIAVDFRGRLVVADASPGRLLRLDADGSAMEFQSPPTAGFYPVAVALRGFFVVALDATTRRLVRFDDRGGWRDVLLDLDAASPGGRMAPVDVAIDDAGRVAVSDADGDRVLVFDPYLDLETVLGGPGRSDGQFVEPAGVALLPGGGLVVADAGAARVVRFDARGAFVARLADARDGLRAPRGLVVDGERGCLVADPEAGRVVALRLDASARRAWTTNGRFEPVDVAVTRDGRIVVVDAATATLRVLEED